MDYVNFNFEKKDRYMIFKILLRIYSHFNINYVNEMIKGDDDCSKIFFDLLFVSPKQINFDNVKLNMDKMEIKQFQNNIIKYATHPREIEYIINIGKDIEIVLDFIYENLNFIISIVEKEKKSFKGFQLNIPSETDNIQQIVMKFIEINHKTQSKGYILFKIEDIFEKMVSVYEKKLLNLSKNGLDEYLLLKNLIDDKIKMNAKILDKYYNNIHEAGMDLIKYNKMTTKEIIDFIKCKDYFYYSNSCYNDRR